MKPNLPNTKVWSLSFTLTEFTPAEAERMTGVSQASQRDWRRHGYLPRHETHARFNFITAAQLYAMRLFADAGKGPQQSSPHAMQMALAIAKTGLVWRPSVWADPDPCAVFDSIPPDGRIKTPSEVEHAVRPFKYEPIVFQEEKYEWLADTLFRELGVKERVRGNTEIIWWPDNEVEIDDYSTEKIHVPTDGLLDQVDPKFDGAASVLHLVSIAANLARRSPKPWLSVTVTVDSNEIINRPGSCHNHGTVSVKSARSVGAAS